MMQVRKYPRTQHIEGSRLQPGDEDLDAVPFERIAGRHVVLEEKVDGANCGISFSSSGELLLQSRGHYLSGGPREKHFALFKQWATVHKASLWRCLSNRYVLYGEWLYAKHTVFYNVLPHYFMEFDVLDTRENEFVDTPRRHELLGSVPVQSVRVVFSGTLTSLASLTSFLGPSLYIDENRPEALRQSVECLGLDHDRVIRETDSSRQMEGLYIKVEEGGRVQERYKFVRADFLACVEMADGHWLNRPIIPNLLQNGVDLFAVEIG